MNIQKVSEFCKWYGKNLESYMELTEFVKELLETRIAHSVRRKKMKIDLYCVQARCKKVDSVKDKLLSDKFPFQGTSKIKLTVLKYRNKRSIVEILDLC